MSPQPHSGQLDFEGLVWNMDSSSFGPKGVVSRGGATHAPRVHEKCPLLWAAAQVIR